MEPLLKPLLNEKIQLSLNIQKDIHIRCSPDQMTQVIMNLVVNARDAMEDKGEYLFINLSILNCDGEAPYAALSVKDDGCGMSESVKSKIFDPYYTTKSNERGTGLGMSTVQGLVKKMSAEIKIESIEGVGTEITLNIPISDEKSLPENSEEWDEEGSHLKGLMIMVVEDEEPVLDILGQVLKSYGADVILAHDGNQALQLQDEFEGDIDVLLTDVVMPECDGLHLSELFKTVRPQTKIIFCSGYPVATDSPLDGVSKDTAFIPKPIKHSTLLRVIKESVARYKLKEITEDTKQAQVKPLGLMTPDKQTQKSLYSMAGNV